MKPKRPQPETPHVIQERDLFQTPRYAVDLIAPHLPNTAHPIWEPACGEGRLTARLDELGFKSVGTDIRKGLHRNALTWEPDRWSCAVTNPPYSLKHRFVQRFIELDKPFAFLVPGDWSGWLVKAVWTYGCELLVPERRINYLTPNILRLVYEKTTLWRVNRESGRKFKAFNKIPFNLETAFPGVWFKNVDDVPVEVLARCTTAQFHSVWLTRYLELPSGSIHFVSLTREAMLTI